MDHKATGGGLISSYTVVGSGTVSPYSNDPRPLSWSDGTPTATSSNNTSGGFIAGIGNGFSITAPADTTQRTLTVYVGGWNSGGRLVAHFSDGSAVDFTDTTATASGQYDRTYTLAYAAASANQTLTVTWGWPPAPATSPSTAPPWLDPCRRRPLPPPSPPWQATPRWP